MGATLIGASAKSGDGIEDLFLELSKQLLKQARMKAKMDNKYQRRGKKMKIEVTDDMNYNQKKECCSII